MKPYVTILTSVDSDFQKALEEFQADPLFSRTDNLYTKSDKERIARIWNDILRPFWVLKWILRALYWRSFLAFGSKNSFVVKYATIVTYYNMLYQLRVSFWSHEEFLRQYLDDTFKENYSTLARYMYHVRFYSILIFPYEFFLSLKDQVDISLIPLFLRKEKIQGTFQEWTSLGYINIWYYLRYRMSLLLSWVSKHGWRLMMHIRISKRKNGFISIENIEKILLKMQPWDILLTRQNWAATNLNIPGFWKHMAMYIWTGKYLKENHQSSDIHHLKDDVHYIIEAVGLWVQIVSFESLCYHNDYLWVVRPIFTSKKIINAIQKTVELVGRGYDYSFNYYSDVHYVCSTLVTKAYLPESIDAEGIHITLTRIATGITYPPNDLVKKMNIEFWTSMNQLDFVWFIDSSEKLGTNFLADRTAFLQSAFRPKLSFFLP